jgi:hypothetical protein
MGYTYDDAYQAKELIDKELDFTSSVFGELLDLLQPQG